MDTKQSMRDLKLNLTLSLLNAQLIKNKELLLHGQLIHHDVDICILTETWLSENDSDRTWVTIHCSEYGSIPDVHFK